MIETQRLLLRDWRESDKPAFAALNADPEVMRYFERLLTEEQSNLVVDRLSAAIKERGWGIWAVEVQGGADFVGFVGTQPVPWQAHFTPAVEVGWRLMRSAWGHGYATEAARACLDFGFDRLQLDEIVALTVPANRRSRAVMERLGMTCDPRDDFDHPRVTPGHPLQRHVLYRAAARGGPDRSGPRR